MGLRRALLALLAAAALAPAAARTVARDASRSIAVVAELLEPVGLSDDEAPGLLAIELAAQELLGSNSDDAPAASKRARKVVKPPAFLYPATAAVVAAVIVFIYGNRGPTVVLSVLCYLTALSTMKLAVKFVFVKYAFNFPKFVTITHFVTGGLTCLLVLWQRRARTGESIAIPTFTEFFLKIVPISAAVSISIGANNIALSLSTVAFSEVVGSTTCLFTVMMVLLLGMPFDKRLIIPTVGVAVGCGVSSAGEMNFSLAAMLLCFLSNTFRALKVSLQQQLMTGETKDKFDPCTLLLWISVPSAIIMLVGSLVSEGLEPYRRMAGMQASTARGLAGAIALSCVNAVCLNLAQLFVTKDLGAVGGQLVAQAKLVLTVLGGMVLFGESVTVMELFGFVLVIGSVYAFAAMEQDFKRQQQAEQKQKEALQQAKA